ncbi:hypothetical protein [Marinobacterium stanieri]|uniref:hypothetical protein n=1 Tax=Marinobacterium stanieri TaxID=49186 RepID=UPI0002557820|nr:hypothetical protein [Marinobacterium stanieri]
MTELLTMNALITLGYALFALLAVFYILRVFDQLGRISFRSTMMTIAGDPHAAALYFGCRFIGVCLLIGLVVGLS